MPVERDAQFLNIDLLVVGRFDGAPLLSAVGDEVVVLHEEYRYPPKARRR